MIYSFYPDVNTPHGGDRGKVGREGMRDSSRCFKKRGPQQGASLKNVTAPGFNLDLNPGY